MLESLISWLNPILWPKAASALLTVPKSLLAPLCARYANPKSLSSKVHIQPIQLGPGSLQMLFSSTFLPPFLPPSRFSDGREEGVYVSQATSMPGCPQLSVSGCL
jgi:hypothetical protein